MSERINTLRGCFDPGVVDKQNFSTTPSAAIKIDRPGLSLEAHGPDLRFAIAPRSLLVLTGQPRSSDTARATSLATNAPQLLLDQFGKPHTTTGSCHILGHLLIKQAGIETRLIALQQPILRRCIAHAFQDHL